MTPDDKAALPIAWGVALLGCVVKLVGDWSCTPTASVLGDVIALLGFGAVLISLVLSKIGEYHPARKIDN